ncbi:luciferin 4-monooxygenase-like [Frankliniella occidentalis]|uniref:Luciferin 4-monooxygenase-like n=1 Tax=Frankliniella occidentalis TaxID=133901 RepID=A0A9C6X9L3_FRAOC|nr:luciferin 4-monooxygenase-like [Frankliniella occidentalis]
MTYKDLVHESVTLARALRTLMKDIRAKTESTRASDAGIAGDDSVVGVFVENRKELLPSLLANLLLGVPVTMLNPLSNTGELVRAWTSTRPSLALCSWGTLAAVLEASVSLPSLTQVVVFPSGNPEADAREAAAANAARRGKSSALRVAAYAELLKRTSKESLDSAEDLANAVGDVLRPLRSDTHTAYLLQCGRGGRIARLTHRNLQYTVQLLQEPDAAGYGWTADDVLLLGAPLSHAFGLGICLGALALGLKVVIMPYFREQLFLSAVQAHKVSQLVLVPRQAALLAHSPLLEDAAVLAPRGLRGVVCAAAPLPRALHRDLTRRLAAPCRQAYGLTQASCSLLVAPRGAPPDTQGRVVPGAEAKVVDAGTGAPLGPLQVGELYLRAPSIMAGYVDYARAQATQDDDDDQVVGGWLRTGDLAYYDRNECVFVVDRLKDVTMYTRGHFKEFDGEHE